MEAPDDVNQAMIRHWVEAMGDENPVYTDEASARANGFPGVIAPATMLQAWIMRGYRSQPGGSWQAPEEASGGASAQEEMFEVFDEAGFTSVVATNCDQEYTRPLVLGDRLTVSSIIDSVSPEKHTGLGVGPLRDHPPRVHRPARRARGHHALPHPAFPAPDGAVRRPHGAPLRPRPSLTQDNAFFFEGASRGELLIQRCTNCGVLRHPPRPACASCGSFEWDTVTSSGRGTVYSYVVVHHPQIPGFDYPLPIAVVELEEGTRLVGDVIGVDPADVRIGMPVVVEMVAVDDELTIPMFRPVDGERAA